MDYITWISENKSWLFEGLGVAIISALAWFIFIRDKPTASQKQKSGNNSVNIQANGNIDITKSNIKNDEKNV